MAKRKVSKSNTKTKKTKKRVSDITSEYAPKKNSPSTVSEELKKLTNVRSKEQVKKPKKVIFMFAFYSVLVTAVLIFCLIKFSTTKKINSSQQMIEYEADIVETTIKIPETTKKVKETTKKVKETTKKAKETTKEVVETSERVVETTEDVETTKKVEETTKKVEETTKAPAKSKTNSRRNSGISKLLNTARKTDVNTNAALASILPKYRDIIYSKATFYQMERNQVALAYSILGSIYEPIKDKIFGDTVDFDTKGTNGIIYLNYNNARDFLTAYSDDIKDTYEGLPLCQYFSYMTNKKFGYSTTFRANELEILFDFKKAVDKGMYYAIPATIIEPEGAYEAINGMNSMTLNVLKGAKLAFTKTFELTATLEIIDKECSTKINPYYSIEDVVGPNPKIKETLKGTAFNIDEMLTKKAFNFVPFDKKGYITDLIYLE